MKNIKKDDVLVICELSRLVPSFSKLIQLGKELKRKQGLNNGKRRIPVNKLKRALEDYDNMGISIGKILSTYNISRVSFYSYIKKRKDKEKEKGKES